MHLNERYFCQHRMNFRAPCVAGILGSPNWGIGSAVPFSRWRIKDWKYTRSLFRETNVTCIGIGPHTFSGGVSICDPRTTSSWEYRSVHPNQPSLYVPFQDSLRGVFLLGPPPRRVKSAFNQLLQATGSAIPHFAAAPPRPESPVSPLEDCESFVLIFDNYQARQGIVNT